MTEWIDLALFCDEAGLTAAIDQLNSEGRAAALKSAAALLGFSHEDVERAALRVLVERARPFALPASLWSRPITASDDPRTHVRAHFARLGITETADRLRLAVQLYVQFAEDRRKIQVREPELQRCGYRCQHCGLAFCNEELGPKALVSPFGLRGAPKIDTLKPHWNGPGDARYPTMDHHWPVSLYGDNTSPNLRVLCGGCNQGKANYLTLVQLPPWVGLPGRSQLLGTGPLTFEVFYSQLRRSPRCETSGKDATAVELTVRLKDPHCPPVLDNLMTVESPGL